MIGIVDYGMGHLRSVHKTFEKVGFPATITQDGEEVHRAEGLVVCGVDRFTDNNLKMPHIGWNSIIIKKPVPILNRLADSSYFYFVHSYYPIPEDQEIVAATTHYEVEFTAAISSGNLFAFQFLPEKSQRAGLQIIKNFGHLVYQ